MKDEKMSVLDQFKLHLKDFKQWRHNLDESVYLFDPDYTIEQQDAGAFEEIDSQWWGYFLGRKQKTCRYSLKCKNKEVYSIPVVSFENEEFAIPFPHRRTVVDPRDKSGNVEIDQFCDIWYFDTESLEFSLLFYFRQGEKLRSPLGSHIKPPIARLPLLFLRGNDEVEKLVQLVQRRLVEFPNYRDAKKKDRDVVYPLQLQHQSERMFSNWVLEISNEL